MATVLLNDQYLSDTADAIREKAGTTQTYTPAQFAEAIGGISGGGDPHTITFNLSSAITGDLEYTSAINFTFTETGRTLYEPGEVVVFKTNATGTRNLGMAYDSGTISLDVDRFVMLDKKYNLYLFIMPDADVTIS